MGTKNVRLDGETFDRARSMMRDDETWSEALERWLDAAEENNPLTREDVERVAEETVRLMEDRARRRASERMGSV